MTATANDDVTGLVLAGGLGRRMGGQDKGLLPFRGRPLVAWVIERLAPQVGPLLVNANRNADRYAEFDCPIVPDVIAGHPGPLAGVYAGLCACVTPYLACAPCDSPFFPEDVVSRLFAALRRDAAEAAVVRTAEGMQSAFMLLQRELAPSLAEYLAGERRDIRGWLAGTRLTVVDFPETAAFANLNHPQDLA